MLDPTRTRAGKANNLFESLTIRQALHKNHALSSHFNLVDKIIEQEKLRKAADIDKQRKIMQNIMEETRKTYSLKSDLLFARHDSKRKNINEVAVHMVNCYMRRQEKHKQEYLDLQEINQLPEKRPVTTPDHLYFIHRVFPETYSFSVNHGWNYAYNPKTDVYSYGRAGHDMMCLSMRNKPVGAILGAYAPQKPVNVRFWRPTSTTQKDDKSDQSEQPRLKYTHGTKKRFSKLSRKLEKEPSWYGEKGKSDFISIPRLGLLEVNEDGVYTVGKSRVKVEDDNEGSRLNTGRRD